MLLLILAILLIVILFGVGFSLHILWIAAVVLLVLFLLGFLFRGAESGGSRRGWYGRRW